MPRIPSRPQFSNVPLSYAFQTSVPRCWKGLLFLHNTSSSTNWHSAHSSVRCAIRDQLFHIPKPTCNFPPSCFDWQVFVSRTDKSNSFAKVFIKMLDVLCSCDVANHPMSQRKHYNHLLTHARFQWKALSCTHHWQGEWKEDVEVYLHPTLTPQVNHPLLCCHTMLEASKAW